MISLFGKPATEGIDYFIQKLVPPGLWTCSKQFKTASPVYNESYKCTDNGDENYHSDSTKDGFPGRDKRVMI